MNNNVPLIIGMSPSTKKGFSDRAFASGVPTTKALIKAVSTRKGDESSFREQYDYVNLDILREERPPTIDYTEAASTLDELLRLGQLEERVIVLLGDDVCSAVARWFGEATFPRPGISTALHPDGWSSTVCAVDHPACYNRKSKTARAEHEAVIRGALQLRCYPTRAEFAQAYLDDHLESARLMEADAALQEGLDEIEELSSADIGAQNMEEYLHLRDYYDRPPYDPDDYD